MQVTQQAIMVRLADLQYDRYEYGFKRSSFRVRGESLDVFPANSDLGIRVEIENNTITTITEFDPMTGDTTKKLTGTVIYPAKHYMTDPQTYNTVFPKIKHDMEKRVEELKRIGKPLEAQRLFQRTTYDLEMIKELGFVNGIENYSRS